jgi:hypothetical protein
MNQRFELWGTEADREIVSRFFGEELQRGRVWYSVARSEHEAGCSEAFIGQKHEDAGGHVWEPKSPRVSRPNPFSCSLCGKVKRDDV